MWQWMGLIALDVANEKAREAQAAAERWRLLNGDDGLEAHVRERRRPFPVRVAAGALRRFSDASLSLGEAACEAAHAARPPDGVTSLHQPEGWRPHERRRRSFLGTRSHRPVLGRRRIGFSGIRRIDGGWREPESLGGTLASAPAVTAWARRPDGGVRGLRRRRAVGPVLGRERVARVGVAGRIARARLDAGRELLGPGPARRLRRRHRRPDLASLVGRDPLGRVGAAVPLSQGSSFRRLPRQVGGGSRAVAAASPRRPTRAGASRPSSPSASRARRLPRRGGRPRAARGPRRGCRCARSRPWWRRSCGGPRRGGRPRARRPRGAARRRSGWRPSSASRSASEGERDVVELAEHRDEARDEVDGADDVAGGGDHGGAPRAAEHRVLAQAPGRASGSWASAGPSRTSGRAGTGRSIRGSELRRAAARSSAMRTILGGIRESASARKSGISRASYRSSRTSAPSEVPPTGPTPSIARRGSRRGAAHPWSRPARRGARSKPPRPAPRRRTPPPRAHAVGRDRGGRCRGRRRGVAALLLVDAGPTRSIEVDGAVGDPASSVDRRALATAPPASRAPACSSSRSAARSRTRACTGCPPARGSATRSRPRAGSGRASMRAAPTGS